jgi:hypothetical protein
MTGVAGSRVEWVVSQGRHQTIPFGDVRIMTLAAVQFRSGLSQVFGLEFLVLDIVAVEADSGHRLGQERDLLAAVGIVAVKAFPVGGGLVGAAGLHPVPQFLVAQITEPARALDEKTGEIPRVRQMTPGALSTDKGRMPAAGLFHAQINIVAIRTKFGLAGYQQALFRRAMRQMAGVAFPVFVGNVDQFARGRGMAIPADIVPARLQQTRPARLVGVMAGHAIAPHDGFMNGRQGQPLTRLVMALGAHLTMGIDRQTRVIRTVRQMATQAVIILERDMNDFPLAVGRLHGMAAEAQVAGRTSQQVVRHHAVSLMTLEAVLLDRDVLGGLEHLVTHVVVALETDLAAAHPQQGRP